MSLETIVVGFVCGCLMGFFGFVAGYLARARQEGNRE